METKICTMCHKELPAEKEFFYPSKTNKRNFRPQCRTCFKIIQKIYKENRKAKISYNTDPQITKLCNNCKQELPATLDFFYSNPSGKFFLNSKCKVCDSKTKQIYRQNEEVKKRELKRIQNYRNKFNKELCQRSREYYEKTKKSRSQKAKIYYGNHKDEYRLRAAKQRAIKIKARIQGFDEHKFLEKIKNSTVLHCYLCGKRIKKGSLYHLEHRIPLSRNGSHSPWNISVSCAKCNLSKHDKTPWEYAPDRFQPELPL